MEIKYLDQAKTPTIFASDDLTAILVIKIAQRLGISVPENSKVIGYDGTYLSRISTLTSLPLNTLGRDCSPGAVDFALTKKLRQKRLLPLVISCQSLTR